MALNSLDDKILGEKVENYCSSSEDENDGSDEEESLGKDYVEGSKPTSVSKQDGKTTQTGPKGVIEDWRRFKQLETEKRERDIAEKNDLCKKLAMTCKSFREEQADGEQEIEEDQDFMEWYKQKRMLEMQQKFAEKWAKTIFGKVYDLDRSNYVEAIEKEKKFITVLIHIYDDDTPACVTVNGCMNILAKKYKNVKFCRINAGEAKVSSNFMENGLPTILVYKENLVIGNFVRVSDTLGDDFYATDLEAFLLEYGMLPSNDEVPEI